MLPIGSCAPSGNYKVEVLLMLALVIGGTALAMVLHTFGLWPLWWQA
jgi:hypothetical protein